MGKYEDIKGTTHSSFKVGGTTSAGRVLTSDENGVGTWQPDADIGLFDIDMNGDIQPLSDGILDQWYEVDENGDIQPKDAA